MLSKKILSKSFSAKVSWQKKPIELHWKFFKSSLCKAFVRFIRSSNKASSLCSIRLTPPPPDLGKWADLVLSITVWSRTTTEGVQPLGLWNLFGHFFANVTNVRTCLFIKGYGIHASPEPNNQGFRPEPYYGRSANFGLNERRKNIGSASGHQS